MSTFHLKISTPDGLLFDGEVEAKRIRARMIDGDVCLLARRADCVSAVGAGEAATAAAGRSSAKSRRLHRRYAHNDQRRSEPDRDDIRMVRRI